MEERQEEKQESRKQMLSAFIHDKGYHPMRFKELAGILMIPKEDRGELKLLLDSLIHDGEIKEQGNHEELLAPRGECLCEDR